LNVSWHTPPFFLPVCNCSAGTYNLPAYKTPCDKKIIWNSGEWIKAQDTQVGDFLVLPINNVVNDFVGKDPAFTKYNTTISLMESLRSQFLKANDVMNHKIMSRAIHLYRLKHDDYLQQEREKKWKNAGKNRRRKKEGLCDCNGWT
jgi:hypothetical protein